jgi:hypothetical protein
VLLVGLVFSLYGQLFGPQPGGFWVLLPAGPTIFVFGVSFKPLGKRFLRACPNGLSGRFAGLQRLKAPLRRALVAAGACVFVSMIVLFVTRGGQPDDDLPVFTAREHYALNYHGKKTEVSRIHFEVVGTAAMVSLHGALFVASGLALYGLIFGRLPEEFARTRGAGYREEGRKQPEKRTL